MKAFDAVDPMQLAYEVHTPPSVKEIVKEYRRLLDAHRQLEDDFVALFSHAQDVLNESAGKFDALAIRNLHALVARLGS